MSITGLSTLDDTVHTTNIWLKDIKEVLNWSERNLALRALRVVLHMLRDRLPTQVSAHFSAQLPMLIRGIYFEGWSGTPADPKVRTTADFLKPLEDAFHRYPAVEAQSVLTAVFEVIQEHTSEGVIAKVLHALPENLREALDQPAHRKPLPGL